MSAALSPLAFLYGVVATRRLLQTGRRIDIPVICVGDPTVGGAGKTPTAIAIARMLLAHGCRPFFLTRGYRGREIGPILVPAEATAADFGDEPLLLARVAPTVVGRDRVAAADLARARGADIVILDDGFQSPSLHKDFSVLVVDAGRGVGNGKIFPAGPLRADLATQIGRAQAVLVVGETASRARSVLAAAREAGTAVWSARLVADPTALAQLKGQRLFAFAGIGHPPKFFATLAQAGLQVARSESFPDHHAYTAAQARDLMARAAAEDLVLVTTEKDHVRLAGDPALAELGRRAFTLPVILEFDDRAAVDAALTINPETA